MLRVLIKKEVLELIRDRKLILSSILVPIVILIMIGGLAQVAYTGLTRGANVGLKCLDEGKWGLLLCKEIKEELTRRGFNVTEYSQKINVTIPRGFSKQLSELRVANIVVKYVVPRLGATA